MAETAAFRVFFFYVRSDIVTVRSAFKLFKICVMFYGNNHHNRINGVTQVLLSILANRRHYFTDVLKIGL